MKPFAVSPTDHLVPVPVLAALHRRAEECGVEFVVIGATARDIAIHALVGRPPLRATMDVDIAIMVAGWEAYAAFTRPFAPRSVPHRFGVRGVDVDVVPIGGVEVEGVVRFSDGGVLDALGLQEALIDPLLVELGPSVVVRVASPAAQTILKLLAWRDRGHSTDKDARDFAVILEASSREPFVAEVWEQEDVLAHYDFDIEVAGAFVWGREAAGLFANRQRALPVYLMLEDVALRNRLIGAMRDGLAAERLRGYRDGFRSRYAATGGE